MMNKEPVFLLAFVTTIIRQLVKAKKIACKHQRDSDDWGINKWLVREKGMDAGAVVNVTGDEGQG